MNKKVGAIALVVIVGVAAIGIFYWVRRSERRAIKPDLTVQYASIEGVDPNLLSYDVYFAKDGNYTANHSIMIYVHGGGWQRGDKSQQIYNKVSYFTNNGFVFISVNYRLTPAVVYPAHNQDVAKAVARIYQDCADYGGNRSKMTIMRHSAGAGIISAIATDERYL